MNITSYEISKQLHEAGFKGRSQTLIQDKVFGEKYFAYDLETLLDALPHHIESKQETGHFVMRKNSIFYETDAKKNKLPKLIVAELKEGKSWADTAALVLLKIIKQKQI